MQVLLCSGSVQGAPTVQTTNRRLPECISTKWPNDLNFDTNEHWLHSKLLPDVRTPSLVNPATSFQLLLFTILFFESLPRVHGRRWELAQRLTGEVRVCLEAKLTLCYDPVPHLPSSRYWTSLPVSLSIYLTLTCEQGAKVLELPNFGCVNPDLNESNSSWRSWL